MQNKQASTEVLDIMRLKITEALHQEGLQRTDILILELCQLFVVYLQDDHPKVLTMWSVFKPMAWVMLIAVTGMIGLIVSGHVAIAIK